MKRIWLTVVLVLLASVASYVFWNVHNDDLRERWEDPEWVKKELSGLPEDLNKKMVEEIDKRIKDTKQFNFAVMGDTRGNHKILKALLEKARLAGAEFVIYTGDLVKSGTYSEYKKATTLLNKPELPLIFIIGNHDCTDHGYPLYYHCFGPVDFYFDLGEWRFICADNNKAEMVQDFISLPKGDLEYAVASGLNTDQLKEMERLLKEKPHNFIVMHQPPLGVWNGHVFKRRVGEFLDMVSRYSKRISMVFLGHIHGYSRKTHEGVIFIISGGAGARLHDRPDVAPFYHFVLISVRDDNVTESVYFLRQGKWTVLKGEETVDPEKVRRIIESTN
jgi:predicted phosphodiesterase